MTSDPAQQERVTHGLAAAASRDLISPSILGESPSILGEAADRVLSLRRWLAQFDTRSLETVGSTQHDVLGIGRSTDRP